MPSIQHNTLPSPTHPISSTISITSQNIQSLLHPTPSTLPPASKSDIPPLQLIPINIQQRLHTQHLPLCPRSRKLLLDAQHAHVVDVVHVAGDFCVQAESELDSLVWKGREVGWGWGWGKRRKGGGVEREIMGWVEGEGVERRRRTSRITEIEVFDAA